MHLVLPSNVAFETFPTNKANHFYTPLSKPLLLEGGHWKVALKEITYPAMRPCIEVWQRSLYPVNIETLLLSASSGKYIPRSFDRGSHTFSLQWQRNDFFV
jgi:hypothetical protein